MGFLDDAMSSFDNERDKPKKAKDYQQPMAAGDFTQQAADAQGTTPPPSAGQGTSSADVAASLSGNELRPHTFNEFIGQDKEISRLKKHISAALRDRREFMHTLITSGPGRGKTTLAHIIASELGKEIVPMRCPVHEEQLIKKVMNMEDGDILLLDEIHLQSKGKSSGNQEEILYNLMEDFVMDTDQGRFETPRITIIGCTTDQGLLKAPLLRRFILKPRLVEYKESELKQIVTMNAKKLEMQVDKDATEVFAKASNRTPYMINVFMRQARSLLSAYSQAGVDKAVAEEILDHEGIEFDGLTANQLDYLEQLWRRKKWSKNLKEWIIKASLATMTHAIGCGRDLRWVMDAVEPELIQRNLIGIGGGGRELTEEGMTRIGVTLPAPPDLQKGQS